MSIEAYSVAKIVVVVVVHYLILVDIVYFNIDVVDFVDYIVILIRR